MERATSSCWAASARTSVVVVDAGYADIAEVVGKACLWEPWSARASTAAAAAAARTSGERKDVDESVCCCCGFGFSVALGAVLVWALRCGVRHGERSQRLAPLLQPVACIGLGDVDAVAAPEVRTRSAGVGFACCEEERESIAVAG